MNILELELFVEEATFKKFYEAIDIGAIRPGTTLRVKFSDKFGRVIGQCSKESNGDWLITYNRTYMIRNIDNPDLKDELMKTIIHEMAHVGRLGEGHNRMWKLACHALGLDYYEAKAVKKTKTLTGHFKYKITCPECGGEAGFTHGKPRTPYYCADCYQTSKSRVELIATKQFRRVRKPVKREVK